jgi:3D (Asp-Asp-Asp) domain-containing protein
MEIREFKNFMLVFVILCFFKFMFTHDFSTRKEQKQVEETNPIVERLKSTEKAVYEVVATMYNAVENQCDADPLITACMYKINPQKASEHKWIAVSRDLLKINGGKFVYGQKVRIVGAGKKSGIYTIADTMNKRFKNKIDILETIGTPLYKFENVKIFAV